MKRIFIIVLLILLLFAALSEDYWACPECGACNTIAIGDKCPACGAVNAALACIKNGHSWDRGRVIEAATCSSIGSIEYTCTVCGETIRESLPKDADNHASYKTVLRNVKEADCTTDGYSGDVYCTSCGKQIKSGVIIPKLGHDWAPATYTAPETCRRCSMTRGTALVEVGDYFKFGSYEQDNNTSNGKEPIEWIVIDKCDDVLVLMSKYALDCQQYNTEHTDVTWETCTLRKWLNEDFYNTAFSAQEQAKIVPVTLENEDNPQWVTTGGRPTTDNVWLLSIKEVTNNRFTSDKVYSNFTDDASRMCAPTKYTVARGVRQSSDYTVDGVVACWWWLRSPGNNSRYAAHVDYDGSVDYYSLSVTSCEGVRPVVVVLP